MTRFWFAFSFRRKSELDYFYVSANVPYVNLNSLTWGFDLSVLRSSMTLSSLAFWKSCSIIFAVCSFAAMHRESFKVTVNSGSTQISSQLIKLYVAWKCPFSTIIFSCGSQWFTREDLRCDFLYWFECSKLGPFKLFVFCICYWLVCLRVFSVRFSDFSLFYFS